MFNKVQLVVQPVITWEVEHHFLQAQKYSSKNRFAAPLCTPLHITPTVYESIFMLQSKYSTSTQ